MQLRSKEMWLVAYFLSKYGESAGKGTPLPPAELGTDQWNVAYRCFYENIAEGRPIRSFERSLKNARDAYDSHLPSSGREGWKTTEGNPNRLTPLAAKIFAQYNSFDRPQLWKEVEKYLTAGAKDYQEVFEALAAMEDPESDYEIRYQTEGGQVLTTIGRAERSPGLRNAALKIHGHDCCVCGFNFEKFYGVWGKHFCEVHHLVPLSRSKDKKRLTDPRTDLVVVCANCHRMLHKKKGTPLSIEELKSKLISKIGYDQL
jgi:5-methylcytosine-specific restriction protein A